MKAVIATLVERLDRKKIAFEVEEELRFHIEMIEREHTQRGMSSAEARAAAMRRFGNLNKIKNQCVEINRRSRPLRRVLKASSILIGLVGLSVHVLSADPNVSHIGDTLVFIAISGRLLLYARGLSPSTFLPRTKGASLLVPGDAPKRPV